jgi:hypothetical protein
MLEVMKIRPVVAKMFHADGEADKWRDGQTCLTNLIVSLRNFAKASKINECLDLEDILCSGEH